MSWENETLALNKELEKAALSREKELDVVIATLETHLSYARTETLRTESLLNE